VVGRGRRARILVESETTTRYDVRSPIRVSSESPHHVGLSRLNVDRFLNAHRCLKFPTDYTFCEICDDCLRFPFRNTQTDLPRKTRLKTAGNARGSYAKGFTGERYFQLGLTLDNDGTDQLALNFHQPQKPWRRTQKRPDLPSWLQQHEQGAFAYDSPGCA
jgi:hypothetical protein